MEHAYRYPLEGLGGSFNSVVLPWTFKRAPSGADVVPKGVTAQYYSDAKRRGDWQLRWDACIEVKGGVGPAPNGHPTMDPSPSSEGRS